MATSVAQKRASIQRLELKIKNMKQHIKNGTVPYNKTDYNAELHYTMQQVIELRNAVCDQIDALLKVSNDKMREFITQRIEK